VSDSGSCADEQDKSMVPTDVLKGLIEELNIYEKETVKPKRKTKKKHAAAKKRELQSNIATAFKLQRECDIENPPNQIVGLAQAQKHILNKFSRSKSSAFETPRDILKTAPNIFDYGSVGSSAMLSPTGAYQHTSGLGCDLPVLTDLLSADQRIPYRSPQKPVEGERRDFSPGHSRFPSSYSNPFSYIYPYHFLAEPGFMLSSLRHSEPYRHYGHYPSIFGSEPSSFHQINPAHLSNPYYSSITPTSSSPWNSQNPSTPSSSESSYEQL
jgi:hypothetical protein